MSKYTVNEHCGEIKLVLGSKTPMRPEDYIDYQTFIKLIENKELPYPSKIIYDRFVSMSAREEFEDKMNSLEQNLNSR